MHPSVAYFVARTLDATTLDGGDVLEVGPGAGAETSVRPSVQSYFDPASYTGVDITDGPHVDRTLGITDLLNAFGREQFDVVVTTEVLEHVADWKDGIRNLKGVCRPGGHAVLTTRSVGYPYHAAPADFWRYEPSDMESIFSDFEIGTVESDPQLPGVFFSGRKPDDFEEQSLETYALYSMPEGERITDSPHPHGITPATSLRMKYDEGGFKRILEDWIDVPCRAAARIGGRLYDVF